MLVLADGLFKRQCSRREGRPGNRSRPNGIAEPPASSPPGSGAYVSTTFMLLCEDRQTTSESRVNMPESPILRVYEPLRPNLIFGACLLASSLLATYIGLRDDALHFLLLDICLFFWAFSHLRRALNAHRKRSILDVYETGFACPERFSGTIAWRDVEAYAATPGESLYLRLRPEAADRLQWRGLEALSRSAPACRRAPISLFTYYGSERLLEAKGLIEARIKADQPWARVQNGRFIGFSERSFATVLQIWPELIIFIPAVLWVFATASQS